MRKWIGTPKIALCIPEGRVGEWVNCLLHPGTSLSSFEFPYWLLTTFAPFPFPVESISFAESLSMFAFETS